MIELYIARIRIRGYQAHEDTDVNLGPGLNVITGPTDSGKTAIIRAIRWVAFNDPTGEAFLNKKVGEVAVTITMSNGVEVTKTRRKGKTTYQVSTIPEPFEKSEVPLEVTQALAIDKQTFGDFVTALNFSYQLDPPFLISETASAGAKILGKIAGTEAVDFAIKDVAKDTYAARQERAQAERDIERVDMKLAEFVELDSMREQLALCEARVADLAKEADRVDDMKQLSAHFNAVSVQLSTYQQKLDKLAGLSTLFDKMIAIDEVQARHTELLSLYSQFININNDLRTAQDKITRLAAIEGLDQTLAQVEQSHSRADRLRELSQSYDRNSGILQQAQATLQKTKGLEEAPQLLAGIEANYTKAQVLRKLTGDYTDAQRKVGVLLNTLGHFDHLPAAETQLQEIAKTADRLTVLKKLESEYRFSDLSLTQATSQVQKATNTLDEAKDALASCWDGLAACPLCEQPIEGSHNH